VVAPSYLAYSFLVIEEIPPKDEKESTK